MHARLAGHTDHDVAKGFEKVSLSLHPKRARGLFFPQGYVPCPLAFFDIDNHARGKRLHLDPPQRGGERGGGGFPGKDCAGARRRGGPRKCRRDAQGTITCREQRPCNRTNRGVHSSRHLPIPNPALLESFKPIPRVLQCSRKHAVDENGDSIGFELEVTKKRYHVHI